MIAQKDRWKIFLALTLFFGVWARLVWLPDMEFKFDESFMFLRAVSIGRTEPWPLLGMNSGVGVPNPGFSMWVFALLSRLFGAVDPVGLARAVALLNIAALLLLIPFVLKFIKVEEREPWFWALALIAVNPWAVLYHRKIWAQSVLPFFSLLVFTFWWLRARKWGAFGWGLLGALLGQIHMSGFFMAAGLAGWTLLFSSKTQPRTRWTYWFDGSVLGAIPLVPWLLELPRHASEAGRGFFEAIQARFWVFWLTDPLGLHLGSSVGYSRGNSMMVQLGDFFRYPLVSGHATYGVALVHAVLVLLGIFVFAVGVRSLWCARKQGVPFFDLLTGRTSETLFAQNALLLGYGILLTASTVIVRRFYLIVTFPFVFVWFSRTALGSKKWGRTCLSIVIVAELFLTAVFLGYIHVNGGAPQGEYGVSYRLQQTPRNPMLKP